MPSPQIPMGFPELLDEPSPEDEELSADDEAELSADEELLDEIAPPNPPLLDELVLDEPLPPDPPSRVASARGSS